MKTIIHDGIQELEVVKVASTYFAEGYTWAVRDASHQRMKRKDGKNCWATKQGAVDAIKEGLMNVNPFEKLNDIQLTIT